MYFARPLLIAVLLTAAAALSCKDAPASREGSSPSAATPGADGPVAKIWISQQGAIELNGQPAQLAAVEKALDDLAQRKGTVYYGREEANAEPPPVSGQVIQLVIDRRLPIRMSARKDFKDHIDADGQSHMD